MMLNHRIVGNESKAAWLYAEGAEGARRFALAMIGLDNPDFMRRITCEFPVFSD